MPSKDEKERRKQIHRELAKKEQEDFIKSLPIDQTLFLELFDYLDLQLGRQGCNHDYSITNDFLKSKGINIGKVFDWFQEHGGYCDCEILNNIEEMFEK